MFKRNKYKKSDSSKMEKDIDRINKAAGFVVDLRRAAEDFYYKDTKEYRKEKKPFCASILAFLKRFYIFSQKRKEGIDLNLYKQSKDKQKKKGILPTKNIRKKKEKKQRKSFKDLFLLKVISRIVYVPGWIVLFLIRFCWIFTIRIFKLILQSIFGKKKIFSDIFYPRYILRIIPLLPRYLSNLFIKTSKNFQYQGGNICKRVGYFWKKIGRQLVWGYNNVIKRNIFLLQKRITNTFTLLIKYLFYSFTKIVRGCRYQSNNIYQEINHSWKTIGTHLLWGYNNVIKRNILILQRSLLQAFKKMKRKKDQKREEKLEERIWEKNQALKEIEDNGHHFLKTISIFAVVAIMFIVPFKAITYYKSLQVDQLRNRVIHSTQAAKRNLTRASASMADLNLDGARANFGQATANFKKARDEINKVNDIILDLAKYIPKDEAKLASMGDELVRAGQLASTLGEELTLAFEGITKADKDDIIGAIDTFSHHTDKATQKLEELNNILSKVDPKALPKEYQTKFTELTSKTEEIRGLLQEVNGVTEELKIFLGEEKDRKYLLVFQNNNELRATGGFIGSYALVEFSEGKIEEVRVPEGGSYDVRAGMTEFYQSPEPLHLASPLWHFWDGNWWPDWPTSARNLMKFYSDSGGGTVDGVISFTPTVLERILKITGPIDMKDEYGIVFTSDNCEEALRNVIDREAGHSELEKFQEDNQDITDPKEVVGDLMNKVVQKVTANIDRKQIVKLIQVSSKSLKEEQILFYFDNQQLQQEVQKRGWGGRIQKTDKDYLSVVNTNIAGKKSDKMIKQDIDHKANIKENGQIINQVKITRTHTGKEDTPQYGARNVNWMRIYIPQGSELKEVEGFYPKPAEVYFEEPNDDWKVHPLIKEQKKSQIDYKESNAKVYNTEIYENRNKKVVAGWFILDPGETENITLKYKLPFQFHKNEKDKKDSSIAEQFMNKKQEEDVYSYSLYIQSQPGVKPGATKLKSQIVYPNTYSPVWQYPEIDKKKITEYKTKLNSDKYRAILLTK